MIKPIFSVALFCLLVPVVGAQQAPPREFALDGKTPAFWKLVDRKAKLEKVTGGFQFTEGPAWNDAGFLYVSDEPQNKLYRVYPDGRKELVLEIGDPDGNTFDRNGQLITCSSVLRAVLGVKPDGKYRILANQFEGKKLNTPNDVVLGPDGALYFTDPTLDLPKTEKQEQGFQGVYRLGGDGSVRLLIKDLNQPNGLAFSPDGKRLYVADSRTRKIHAYDVAADMSVANGRVFGIEEGRRGVPDGIRVDRKGNLFATGPGGIWIWSPAGVHLGTILLPESAANLAWGDADKKTLYITASTSVYRLKVRTRGFVPK